MNRAHLARVVAHQRDEGQDLTPTFEASIRKARIDKARAEFEAAKARILTWKPGDREATVEVLTEALGAADNLIAALEG